MGLTSIKHRSKGIRISKRIRDNVASLKVALAAATRAYESFTLNAALVQKHGIAIFWNLF